MSLSSTPDRFGPYTDLRPLKPGGFGQVYAARHAVLDRVDAIKMLAPGLIQDDEDSKRFTREASAMARLNHPNIVRVHTAGVENGFPYIAMEYVEGEDLEDAIRARGPMEIAEVERLGREIGSALAHIHAQGIVHRDLKSANILRRASDGRFFLADFGIALQQNLSRISSTTLGSQEYISPEQIDGHTDARSDLYSFGVVLFEATTGQVPFKSSGGNSHKALLNLFNQIMTEKAPLASSLRAGVPGWLDDAIASCLEKAPEARPQRAVDLIGSMHRPRAATARIPTPFQEPPEAPEQSPAVLREPTRQLQPTGFPEPDAETPLPLSRPSFRFLPTPIRVLHERIVLSTPIYIWSSIALALLFLAGATTGLILFIALSY